MARQRFQAGVGGTLRLRLEEQGGPPTGATVTIKATTGQDLPTPVAGAAATISPVSTSLSAPAAGGASQVTLTDVTGVRVGSLYLVTPQSGAAQVQVQVSSVDTGTRVVGLAAPLDGALQAGDAFLAPEAAQGVELSYVLSGAQCPAPSSPGPVLDLEDAVEPPAGYGHSYRAVWSYTLGGQEYQADQLYEVRLRLLRPTLTDDQVQRQLPANWEDLVAGGAEEVAAILADAWDDLLDEVEAKGYDPDRIMDAGRLHRPHRSLVVWMLARTWGSAWREWAQDRKTDAEQDLEAALASGGWYDTRADAVQTPAEVKWPSIRLTR